MWTNNQSIQKAQHKLTNLKPPFCANPECEWHQPSKIPEDPFQKYGTKRIARFPYLSQRFRCKQCWRTFSSSFFTLQYRDRRPDNYEELHDLLLNGYSGKAVGRRLKVDEDTVRRRKKKLARWALLAWAKDLEKVKINESVAYDGLENFSYSQYDINNLNHAVGRESYYVYDFNLSPMNRKGKMSPRQMRIKAALDEEHGKYDSAAITKDSGKIFERLLAKSEKELQLHTDRHHAYRRALEKIKGRERINHAMTSSKIARNFENRLFAINHTDMLTRHLLGTFKRETIAFAKNSVAMLESFVLFATHKNYLRPQFYRKHKQNPRAHLDSPAMSLGLRDKVLSFNEFYRTRISFHHVTLNPDWESIFDSTDLRSRRTIRAYAGI